MVGWPGGIPVHLRPVVTVRSYASITQCSVADRSAGFACDRNTVATAAQPVSHFADGSERTWRGGTRWEVAPAFSLSLEGSRREPANDEAPVHALELRAARRW